MIDTWATVGRCAQIGRDCHLSGGVGIGGVLEPPGARPRYTHTPGAANQGPPQPGSTGYGYDYAGSYNTYYDVANR